MDVAARSTAVTRAGPASAGEGRRRERVYPPARPREPLPGLEVPKEDDDRHDQRHDEHEEPDAQRHLRSSSVWRRTLAALARTPTPVCARGTLQVRPGGARR